MINLLIGPPGGGKSYEAVVYHILPALQRGRKIITNLPLDLERLALIDSAYIDLIEIRTKTKAVRPEVDWNKAQSLYQKFGIAAKPNFFVDRPFAHADDYGDSWRHSEDGSGPLYVIDECHLALPAKTTKIEVEEWFSLHRHELADVLLITQSYGKVSRSIIDLVQVCYRVKKGTAFGTANNYIRKVQDGVRGEVVNTGIRKYEKRYFGLYKSHTKSGAGVELAADDIKPIWKHWTFIGAASMFILAAIIFSAGGSPNILDPQLKAPNAPQHVSLTPVVQEVKKPVETPPAIKEPEPETHPYSGRTLHIAGSIASKTNTVYHLVVAQNGQPVSQVDSTQLEALGYRFKAGSVCAAQVGYGKWTNWIICDAPQVSIASGQGVQSGSRDSAGGVLPSTMGKT